MKKTEKFAYITEVLCRLATEMGGSCFIRPYDKDGMSITAAPLLLVLEKEGVVTLTVDGYYDETISADMVLSFRDVVAGKLVRAATVYDHRDGRNACYANGNDHIDGIRFNIFDQSLQAKSKKIRAEEWTNQAMPCTFSTNEHYLNHTEKEEDIILN